MLWNVIKWKKMFQFHYVLYAVCMICLLYVCFCSFSVMVSIVPMRYWAFQSSTQKGIFYFHWHNATTREHVVNFYFKRGENAKKRKRKIKLNTTNIITTFNVHQNHRSTKQKLEIWKKHTGTWKQHTTESYVTSLFRFILLIFKHDKITE